MPVTLTEDFIDLTLEGVEFVPYRLDGPPSPCHPLPQLRKGGTKEPRSFRSLILENDLLSLTLLPDLGGRVLRLLDKRTGRDFLPWPPTLELHEGSHRGLWLNDGIRFLVGDTKASARNLDLAPVEYQLREAQDEDSPGMVLCFELLPGGAASWQGGVTLYPDRAEILIEFSLINRTRQMLDIDTGLALPIEGALWCREDGSFGWSDGDGKALWIFCEPAQGSAHQGPHSLLLRPRAEESPLLPHEVFSWSVRLAPYTGLGRVQDASRSGGLGRKEEQLILQSSEGLEKASLRLETADGSFAAEASLNPMVPFAANLSALPAIQSLTLPGDIPLRWGASECSSVSLGRASRSAWRSSEKETGSDESLFLAGWNTGAIPSFPSNPALTSAWHLARAEAHVREESWAMADKEADQSLILNGEDSLAWWLKSVIRRKMGESERPELLNAHYLTPLEPLLRAESFLQQGGAGTKEGSPMTLRLAKNPDLGLECIDQILSLGLTMEAGMLMDEILRHDEIGLVRLMLAWSLLTKSRMEAEAARHLSIFEKNQVMPPLPARPREIQAVQELHARFPALERLREMAHLAHPRSIG